MIFNGIDLSSHFRIKNIVGRNYADYQWNLIDVPGMDGVHLGGGRRPPRYIDVYTAIYGKDRAEIRKKIDMLNGIFAVESPVPIIFPDEPDRTYFGVIEMTDDQGDRFFRSDGSFTILCPDPYKYGPELEATFPSDAVTVTNNGTAPAKPVFELEVNESTTFAMVSNGEEYLMMGRPVQEGEDEPIDPLTPVTDRRLNTFVGWDDVAQGFAFNDPLAEGIVAGSFGIGSGQWYVPDYGTNPNGWHGPAKRTSLGQALQDFQVDYFISNYNFEGQLGKNVLMLTDANNNIIASMGAIDRTIVSGYYGKVQFYLGGEKRIFDFQGFNNTQIWLRLKREGNVFTAMAYQLDENGNTRNRVTETFVDTLLEYQQPISQAIIYLATFKNYAATRMYANRITASIVNDVSEGRVPIIAHPGDKIEMDFVTRALRINGELRKDLISMGSRFFNLKPGNNSLAVMPEDTFNTTIRYREPFK